MQIQMPSVGYTLYYNIAKPAMGNPNPLRRVDQEFKREFLSNTGHPDLAQLGRTWLNRCLTTDWNR
jgi:hypothetical protein